MPLPYEFAIRGEGQVAPPEDPDDSHQLLANQLHNAQDTDTRRNIMADAAMRSDDTARWLADKYGTGPVVLALTLRAGRAHEIATKALEDIDRALGAAYYLNSQP
jgi:hypothetical protein